MENYLENKRRSLKFLGYSEEEVENVVKALTCILKTENCLSKDEALALAKQIRPVVSSDIHIEVGKPRGNKVWLVGSRIYDESYIYNTENDDYTLANDLVELAEITTYHQCHHQKVLRPTIYEVLCQIPQELRDKAVAFELYVEKAGDVYNYPLDRHILKCVLYTGKQPDKIANCEVCW
ncbi:MAG: hypothetical protein IJF12_02135 [Alphaproteobacteria bacterium]|nr:hypothetical protein [Alphaproteobacteria bacterium]MBQ2810947.1 hypothetical protein [Alphaproteobacteria bacterium]